MNEFEYRIGYLIIIEHNYTYNVHNYYYCT